MGKFLIRKWGSFFIVLMLALSVSMLTGCEGDDGAPGAQGVQGEPGDPGPQGPPGPVAETDESCNVCHGEGASHDFANEHPADMDEFLHVEFTSVDFTGEGGDQIVFCFEVLDADDELVDVNLDSSRFYLASLIPADTPTDWGTFDTGYFERWAYERDREGYPLGELDQDGPGEFCYTFATAFNPEAISDLGDPGAVPPEPPITVGEMAPDITYGIFPHDPPIPSDFQRVVIRVSGQDVGEEPDVVHYANAVGIVDVQNVNGEWVFADGDQRVLAPISGCKECHSDKMEGAAHGGSYLDTKGCVICHTPIGLAYGEEMQDDDAWLTTLIHRIHSSQYMAAFTNRIWVDENADGIRQDSERKSYDYVTYPWVPNEDYVEYGGIQDCLKCHNGDDNMTDAWATNPTREACGSCHTNVDFDTGENHGLGGSQPTNDFCAGCHPPAGEGFGGSVAGVHEIDSTPNYTTSITISADDDATPTVYEAGDEILVTVTTSNIAAPEYAVPGATARANLYVYGPRAKAVPVLTTMSTTDPAYISMTTDEDDPNYDPEATPQQSHSMLVDSSDPQVRTDADGFKYQLLAIPEDLAPGTYMVMVYVTTELADCSAIYRNSVCIDGWQLINFQVETATPELKVAGDGCTNCHLQENWGGLYHRSYFGTDGCLACHDQSGNHADPIANRVHAVHAASRFGDLLGADWTYTTYPQGSQSQPPMTRPGRCETCHDSGNESYITLPASWGAPCIGCHGNTDGSKDHMIQMGSDFPEEE